MLSNKVQKIITPFLNISFKMIQNKKNNLCVEKDKYDVWEIKDYMMFMYSSKLFSEKKIIELGKICLESHLFFCLSVFLVLQIYWQAVITS